jgi:hypothetical protein
VPVNWHARKPSAKVSSKTSLLSLGHIKSDDPRAAASGVCHFWGPDFFKRNRAEIFSRFRSTLTTPVGCAFTAHQSTGALTASLLAKKPERADERAAQNVRNARTFRTTLTARPVNPPGTPVPIPTQYRRDTNAVQNGDFAVNPRACPRFAAYRGRLLNARPPAARNHRPLARCAPVR